MAVPLQKLNHNGPIYCLAATSKGFLAGSVLGRVLQYQVPTTDSVRTCACTPPPGHMPLERSSRAVLFQSRPSTDGRVGLSAYI
jgi:hypothetical protein